MEYYTENNHITKPMRKSLSSHMVKYFVSNKIWIKRGQFAKVNSLIAQEFPTENVSHYYRPSEGKRGPGGILYNKYKSECEKLRKLKLLNYKNKKRQHTATTQPQTACSMTPSSAETDDIEYLRFNCNPVNVIEQKWQATSKLRLKEFKSMEQIEQVTAKYPLLTNTTLNQILVSISTHIMD